MHVAETKRKRNPEPPVRPVEPAPGKLLLTIPEIMFLTGYSERAIRALLAEGRLRNSSVDRIIRVRRMDVLRLVDNKPPRDY